MTTKEMITKVAEKEFVLRGYADTTLRRIAAKCNITATAIYRHYTDKEEHARKEFAIKKCKEYNSSNMGCFNI